MTINNTFTLYNTLTKQKEIFKPIHPGKVSIYACGPTVYDYAHMGNWKTYITNDLLRRHLEYLGYEVRHIENITDVGHLTRDDISQGDTGEDKIAMRAKKEHKTPQEIARFYETYFKDTLTKLNILPAHYFPRATEHIPHMIKLIEALIANGHAYTSNGSVFYDISSFSHYGELSGNTLEHLRIGARLEAEHPDKKNQWDFALWLKAPKDHLMQWNSPWGIGYPGWHIECSAMSLEYLGNTFDIHMGGEDHIFPHHEAEIAQSEGVTHIHPFVHSWIHTRHMMVEGKKMSKSKGTTYKLEDIEENGYTAMHLRMALLSAHYRSQMNFTWDALAQAKKNFERITSWITDTNTTNKATNNESRDKIQNYEQRFWDALNDDLNTPKALSVLYELITFTNTNKRSVSTNTLKSMWNKMNSVLGFILPLPEREAIPGEIVPLISERDKARGNKDFQKSDELRARIESLGYIVEDSPNGTKIKKQ